MEDRGVSSGHNMSMDSVHRNRRETCQGGSEYGRSLPCTLCTARG